MGSNPSTVYWMDIFPHIFVVKIVGCLFEKTKINEKEVGDGLFFVKILSPSKNGFGFVQSWLAES